MDLALPYVTANVCALFIVGYLAVSSRRKGSSKRNSADTKHDQSTRVQAQAQTRARARARSRAQSKVQHKPPLQKRQEPPILPGTPGAGALLIQMFARNLVVLLVREGGVFTDPGGAVVVGETPERCATRELEQETAGTLIVNVANIQTHPVTYREYCGFLIPCVIDSLDDLSTVFEGNSQWLQPMDDVLPEWKETDQVNLFNVSEIFNVTKNVASGLKDTYQATDTDGTHQWVSDRVVGLIQEAARRGALDAVSDALRNSRGVRLQPGLSTTGIGPPGSRLHNISKGVVRCWSVVHST